MFFQIIHIVKASLSGRLQQKAGDVPDLIQLHQLVECCRSLMVEFQRFILSNRLSYHSTPFRITV